MGSSKFWKGVLLGAIVGGAISLLDRTTRTSVKKNIQNTSGKIAYFAKHPQETIDTVKETSRKIRSTVEEVGEEVSFIAEKIDELRELTPQVVDIVKDTKDAFVENEFNEGQPFTGEPNQKVHIN
jgi:gas vesicle protein